MSGVYRHMRISIRGAMLRPDSELHRVFNHDDGRPMSVREARIALMDELAKGHLYLPLGKCDNFDPKEGCMGHKEVAE